jgi:hypothetical protein
VPPLRERDDSDVTRRPPPARRSSDSSVRLVTGDGATSTTPIRATRRFLLSRLFCSQYLQTPPSAYGNRPIAVNAGSFEELKKIRSNALAPTSDRVDDSDSSENARAGCKARRASTLVALCVRAAGRRAARAVQHQSALSPRVFARQTQKTIPLSLGSFFA